MAGAQRGYVSAVTPLRRAGAPEDIARAVLFFASPLASYISGSTLLLHGGGEPPAFLEPGPADERRS